MSVAATTVVGVSVAAATVSPASMAKVRPAWAPMSWPRLSVDASKRGSAGVLPEVPNAAKPATARSATAAHPAMNERRLKRIEDDSCGRRPLARSWKTLPNCG